MQLFNFGYKYNVASADNSSDERNFDTNFYVIRKLIFILALCSLESMN